MKLPKTYNATKYESDIYQKWEEAGAFKPQKGHRPFAIVLPPPNATGQLHLGHAVMLAVEDTLVRFARMKGRETVWIPGTDHAAIATENVVIRELEKEGMKDPRQELGREQLVKRIHEYVEKSRGTIRNQIRLLGASVDWTRERYTMEPAMNRVVSQVFMQMAKDELIYRGDRIVNWDPKLQTNVSDDEVERVEEKATLYTLKYGPFEIATARPETKFGDKYVVMHPDDKRYEKYNHGDTFQAEWINGKVKATVIKDEAIDPEFGTGVMTITPWHDATDFEIAQRHDITPEQIIDFDGKLMDIAEEFKGMAIEEARPKIVEKLKKKGLLVSENPDYTHNVAVNSRGKGIIEPQIMRQWFVDVDKKAIKWKGKTRSLKEIMQEVIESSSIKIIPKHFEKTYFHWINNLRDWCISRQIWWGHRIPAWYKDDEIHIGETAPDGSGWQQDPDTLDTWFSSAMWTWSTLIQPREALNPDNSLVDMLKKSPDFRRYHPTQLLETGYDILFFWVARMILMTTYVTGQIPFENVYLHGLVRTRDGRKMSKSDPETIIDPVEIVPKYGADALRLSMIIGQTPGKDTRLYEEKIAGYRNFCNKLWNVGRYVFDNVETKYLNQKIELKTSADHWIYERLQDAVEEITSDLESYRISDAGQKIYSLLWDDFADWYVEASKVNLNPTVLIHAFRTILRLSHPFAPFVTETLWQHTSADGSLLINEPWPEPKKIADRDQSDGFSQVINIVSEIRNLQKELQLKDSHLYYRESEFLDDNCGLVVKLTGIKGCERVADGQGIHLIKTNIDCWLDVDENITRDYLFKLIRRRDAYEKEIKTLKARLENANYVKQAPKELVEETKQKLADSQETLKALSTHIDNIEHVLQVK